MLLWHAIFSLFGATIIRLYFISGMFYERDYQDMENLLMENGWIVVLIPNVGMSQMDGSCTCLWSRKHEKHLTRVTQFDKTQQNIKQHICKVFHGMEHIAAMHKEEIWHALIPAWGGLHVNHPAKGEVSGPLGLVGRPPWSADGPVGPTASTLHLASPYWLINSVPGGMVAARPRAPSYK